MPVGAAIRNTGTLAVICAGGVRAERKPPAPYRLCSADLTQLQRLSGQPHGNDRIGEL